MSKYMEIPLKDEWFIHITTKENAELILKSKKLLASKSKSVTGETFAISTLFGIWSPYLPSEILKATDKTHVAIMFQVTTKPNVAEIGQIVWKKDISIKKAKMIKLSKAKDELSYKRVRKYAIPTLNTPPIKYI